MPLCPKCKFSWKSTLKSNNQNSYYWGVLVDLISDHTGYSPEDVHEILKHKFLTKEAVIKGEKIPFAQSTVSLTTVEFEKYMSQARQWAAMELSISIPEPNEQLSEA